MKLKTFHGLHCNLKANPYTNTNPKYLVRIIPNKIGIGIFLLKNPD